MLFTALFTAWSARWRRQVRASAYTVGRTVFPHAVSSLGQPAPMARQPADRR